MKYIYIYEGVRENWSIYLFYNKTGKKKKKLGMVIGGQK